MVKKKTAVALKPAQVHKYEEPEVVVQFCVNSVIIHLFVTIIEHFRILRIWPFWA